MLVKERAEREGKRNNSPLLDNAMEAAWRSGGLEPLHHRPNGPRLEGGIALGTVPP